MLRRCPECLEYFDQVARWQVICKRCYAKSKAQANGTAQATKSGEGYFVSLDLMKKIRQLTHPDRHDASQLANSVTSELNKLMTGRTGKNS